MRPETLRPTPFLRQSIFCFSFHTHPSIQSLCYNSRPVSFSTRLVQVFLPQLIHHVLSPAVMTPSCNYLIFMRKCLSCISAALALCTLRVPLTPCPGLKELRVIIQARGRRLIGPQAQRHSGISLILHCSQW